MPESRLSDRLPGQFLMNTLLLCPGNSGATKYTAHWPGSVEIFMLIINSEKLACYQKREQRQANGTKVQPGNQKGGSARRGKPASRMDGREAVRLCLGCRRVRNTMISCQQQVHGRHHE